MSKKCTYPVGNCVLKNQQLTELKILFSDLLECGEWYTSALEIEVYAGWNGEKLKKRIQEAYDEIRKRK